MCAIFGFLNYGNKVDGKTLKKLIRALSVNAETRGTDATGISYVGKDGNIRFLSNRRKNYFHLLWL